MPSADEKKVAAALSRAAQQLDAAIHETEQATDRILGLAERLHEHLNERPNRLLVEAIMEACAFQDLTGQRIRKVQRLIKYLHANKLVEAKDLPQEHQATKVGLSQAEVDRLLNGK